MQVSATLEMETARARKVIGDVLSQAVTGELVGMSNFASLAGVVDDLHEKMEAVEHAESERQHALGFMHVAEKYGLPVQANMEGYYWKTIREKFLYYAGKQDFIACLIIQEIMLESFAVSMYKDAGEAIGGEIGALLVRTSEEEKEHLHHATHILRQELAAKGQALIDTFKLLHDDVMTVLAQWTAAVDTQGHCGICNGTCMKDDLEEIGLTLQQVRGNAFRMYAQALDTIGLPGEETTIWIINLPF